MIFKHFATMPSELQLEMLSCWDGQPEAVLKVKDIKGGISNPSKSTYHTHLKKLVDLGLLTVSQRWYSLTRRGQWYIEALKMAESYMEEKFNEVT